MEPAWHFQVWFWIRFWSEFKSVGFFRELFGYILRGIFPLIVTFEKWFLLRVLGLVCLKEFYGELRRFSVGEKMKLKFFNLLEIAKRVEHEYKRV